MNSKGQFTIQNFIILCVLYVVYFSTIYLMNEIIVVEPFATYIGAMDTAMKTLWNFVLYIGIPIIIFIAMVIASKPRYEEVNYVRY